MRENVHWLKMSMFSNNISLFISSEQLQRLVTKCGKHLHVYELRSDPRGRYMILAEGIWKDLRDSVITLLKKYPNVFVKSI